ncbi:MAG: type II secretion system F family protein [Actinobacteria bacterium]|nr:type II secretion system F family protein [Actinomycetota bacterium]
MDFIVYFTVFITLSLLFFLALSSLSTRRDRAQQRIREIQMRGNPEQGPEGDDQSFSKRVIGPTYQKFLEFLGKLTPNSIVQNYKKSIIQAGLEKEYTPLRIIGLQVLLALVLGGVCILIVRQNESSSPALIPIFALIGIVLPISLVRSKANKRRKLIERSLPDLLDLLYISVEAGLGFDSALKKSAQKMQGPLSVEVMKALADINKGRNRIEAFKSIADRTEVDDVRSFLMAVIQSEKLGSNVSTMLRTQSRVMRQKRQQRAEEKAQRLPVLMLLPLVFLMFPALFVVLLGPAAMNLLKIF